MANGAALRKSAASTPDQHRAASPWRDPGPTGDRLEVEDFPSFLLMRLGSLAKSKLTRLYLDRAALSLPEWRLLNLLARFSPTTYPALVRRSTMDKAQISLTLRTLVAHGWATWEGAAANDRTRATRRATRIIAIAPRGRAVIRKLLPEARRAQMRVLGRLTVDERVRLYTLLQKLCGVLDPPDESGR